MSARGPGGPHRRVGSPRQPGSVVGCFPARLPQGQPQRAGAADESPACHRDESPGPCGGRKRTRKTGRVRAVELAVALLMWAVGSAFGALGLSSFEGGECERGERYLLYMAYFWLVALAAMVSSSVLSGRAVLVLACLAAIFFVGVVVVPGRLLGRSMREEDLGTRQRRLW